MVDFEILASVRVGVWNWLCFGQTLTTVINYAENTPSPAAQKILAEKGIKTEEIKGIKICRQAKAMWQERFDKRITPFGKEYYWLTGEFVNQDKGEDTDEWALANDYISIVPVQFDLTAHHAIQTLNTWNL